MPTASVRPEPVEGQPATGGTSAFGELGFDTLSPNGK
jgi:hypothetical protein